jgi:phytoene dehydrogenase-like protein
LIVNNYAQEKDYAPEGCSVITALLGGESYTFWKSAREDGSYKEKKEEVIRAFLERIVQYIPEIEGNVEVANLATPLTYERYCDTFEGSYMTHWLPKRAFLTAPIHYKKGLYFAGQRTSYSGGLPPAATSARTAAQYLCRDFNVEFVSK